MITKFSELYSGETETQALRYENLKKSFGEFFNCDAEVEYFSAPGRTEIGGNHTDHQLGRVVAASVNLDVIAAVQKRDDNIIVLKSAEYEKYDTIDISNLDVIEDEKETSASLIRGLCARFVQLGYKVGGFNAYTVSNVLKGSGLSSSAAFEVLVATIINHVYNDGVVDSVSVAKMSQYAENVYFGKPSGLLDQSASSVGGVTAIDFKDSANTVFENISFDLRKYGYNLCVVDTGGNHADLTNEYADVPGEIKKISAFFGKSVLREIDEADFKANIPELRKTCGDRAVLRAMHFYGDNQTALDQANALKAGDFDTFKSLVIKSGRSSFMKLQNVYASSAPQEQGLSLALALAEEVLEGQGAWRVHGGGFAGTIQAYVPDSLLEAFKAKMESVFGEKSCYVLSVRAAGGTKVEM